MRADTFDQFLGKISLSDIVHERVPYIAGWLFGELRASSAPRWSFRELPC